jgi:murein endopeptidase
VAGCSSTETTKTADAPKQANSEPVKETPAQSSVPQVIGSWSGNAMKTTDTFHVSSDKWTIRWDTKPGQYGDMNFIIYVYTDSGSLKDVAANVIGASNDKTVIRGSGDYYLKIVTSQPYTIEVVA